MISISRICINGAMEHGPCSIFTGEIQFKHPSVKEGGGALTIGLCDPISRWIAKWSFTIKIRQRLKNPFLMRGKMCVNIPLGAYPSGRSIHARTGRVLQRSAGRSGNFKLPSSTFHPELKFERHRGWKRGWGQMWGFEIKRRFSDKKSKRYNWRSGIHLRRRTPKKHNDDKENGNREGDDD